MSFSISIMPTASFWNTRVRVAIIDKKNNYGYDIISSAARVWEEGRFEIGESMLAYVAH